VQSTGNGDAQIVYVTTLQTNPTNPVLSMTFAPSSVIFFLSAALCLFGCARAREGKATKDASIEEKDYVLIEFVIDKKKTLQENKQAIFSALRRAEKNYDTARAQYVSENPNSQVAYYICLQNSLNIKKGEAKKTLKEWRDSPSKDEFETTAQFEQRSNAVRERNLKVANEVKELEEKLKSKELEGSRELVEKIGTPVRLRLPVQSTSFDADNMSFTIKIDWMTQEYRDIDELTQEYGDGIVSFLTGECMYVKIGNIPDIETAKKIKKALEGSESNPSASIDVLAEATFEEKEAGDSGDPPGKMRERKIISVADVEIQGIGRLSGFGTTVEVR
jgi:hypothetical protein